MKIINHRLLKDNNLPYSFLYSPNYWAEEIEHKFLVIHFTNLPDMDTAFKYLSNPKKKISAHIIIGRDGSIIQLVPFNFKAWHAGDSNWKGFSKLNHYSIGVELDNAGKLQRKGNKWVSWLGKEYDESEVIIAKHKNETEAAGWHIYPQAQIDTAVNVCRLLVRKYNLTEILGHDDIAIGRKIDPGPAFPMENFRERVLRG